MSRSILTGILRFVGILIYSAALAFVLLMVGFSEGKVLDFSAAASGANPLPLIAISLVCWIILLALPIWLAIAFLKRFALRLRGS